jgi:hypothetical protein
MKISNKMIKLGGNKILPFRRATICYTGGSKGAVRDFNFHEKKAYLQTVKFWHFEFRV